MKVQNMTSSNGNKVANQFIIFTDTGSIFQSYDSVIAIQEAGKKTRLDARKWDCSKTTGKYRNQFLGENKAETERKIKDGTYTLANLNN